MSIFNLIQDSWKPQESTAQLWAERSYLNGIFIGAVAYGAHATLFFLTLKLLMSSRKEHRLRWIAYIVLLFILSSVGNGAQLRFTQMIFIDYRNYPGGPAVFYVEGSTDFVAVFCNSVYTVNTWLQDGLLLYRFSIIFGGSHVAVALPGILFISSVALGCVVIFMLSRPGMTIWSQTGFQLVTSYWAVSVALNVLLTGAIVARLLLMRRRIGKAAAGPYGTISAMLVESAFLYSACGVLFLVSYGLDSPVQNLVLPTLAQVQSIAPLLIIMRVAQGQAWSTSTAARVSTGAEFAFRKGARSNSAPQDFPLEGLKGQMVSGEQSATVGSFEVRVDVEECATGSFMEKP